MQAAVENGRRCGTFLAAYWSAQRATRNARRTTLEEGTEAGRSWAMELLNG
jgi:hypothetical protein